MISLHANAIEKRIETQRMEDLYRNTMLLKPSMAIFVVCPNINMV